MAAARRSCLTAIRSQAPLLSPLLSQRHRLFIDGVNLTYGKMLLVFIFGLVGLFGDEALVRGVVACCGLAASEIVELLD